MARTKQTARKSYAGQNQRLQDKLVSTKARKKVVKRVTRSTPVKPDRVKRRVRRGTVALRCRMQNGLMLPAVSVQMLQQAPHLTHWDVLSCFWLVMKCCLMHRHYQHLAQLIMKALLLQGDPTISEVHRLAHQKGSFPTFSTRNHRVCFCGKRQAMASGCCCCLARGSRSIPGELDCSTPELAHLMCMALDVPQMVQSPGNVVQVSMLEDSNVCAIHAGRVTIM